MHIVTPSAFQWDCTKEELERKKKKRRIGEGRGEWGSGGTWDTRGLHCRARVELDKYEKRDIPKVTNFAELKNALRLRRR